MLAIAGLRAVGKCSPTVTSSRPATLNVRCGNTSSGPNVLNTHGCTGESSLPSDSRDQGVVKAYRIAASMTYFGTA